MIQDLLYQLECKACLLPSLVLRPSYEREERSVGIECH